MKTIVRPWADMGSRSDSWYSAANLRRWLRLAGGQCQIVDVGGARVEFCAEPASRWRFVPLLGEWRMFRLGQELPFRVSATVIESSGTAMDLTVKLSVFVEERPTHIDNLDFAFSGEVGETIRQVTDPFFLLPTGDAVLRSQRPGPQIPDLYTFRVEEPINKVVAIVAASFFTTVGGLAIWVVSKVWGDRGGFAPKRM